MDSFIEEKKTRLNGLPPAASDARQNTRSWPRVQRWLLAACILLSVICLSHLTLNNHANPSAQHSPRLRPCPLSPPTSNPLPANRKRLNALLSEKFGGKPLTFALPTSARTHRDDSDMENSGWRTSSNVMYILGRFGISDAVVIVDRKDDTELNVSMFLPEQTERQMIFEGGFADPAVLAREFNVQRVGRIADVPTFLGNRTVLTLWRDELTATLGKEAEKVDMVESEELREAFEEARFVKNEAELEHIAYAGRVAAWVHREVEKEIRHGRHVNEITLASLFTHLSATCSSRLQAYPPIVGAGTHASVLHYRTGENETAGYNPITSHPKPTFVLIDAAGEYRGYASDLTRTYARHGRWSKEMKVVYGIVENAQNEAWETYGEGVELEEVNRVAFRSLLTGLSKHGFFKPEFSVDELLEAGALYVFMPHGLGHPVGLDVHDPTPSKYLNSRASTLTAPPAFVTLKSPQANYLIPRGHVMTIEPGIYFIPALWEVLKAQGEAGLGRFVEWEVVEGFRGVGGVRIEDVVMVDGEGRRRVVTRV
ncbi:peptidase M24, structural domain-containing protein [Fimicolochytrium jonesii]|uniref:peptidase M24, structural domain-containing protein n=1 Tax=Fimicolochytrium jonesii TaxID=1396493 RepID=UPI0022FE1109|nr:peptidase M24, structural domain-containing protein [Fimicolochytrium jonesii]KAI8820437.1 peptidase M24, structural domain-containing protein [Fimicolochytrium jonesii]